MRRTSITQAVLALIALLAGAAPPPTAHAGDRYHDEVFPKVRITRDVVYASGTGVGDGNADLLLDLYEPEGDEESARPLMVWIHGGGFFQGDKADAPIVKLATHFARCGFVCASINYTLLLQSSQDWSSAGSLRRAADRAAEDARRALEFLASRRTQLQIDTARLVVGGSSAGAFTALQLGCERRAWGGMEVRGIVEFWGGLMDVTVLRAGAPPILAIHGTADMTVPYAFAERLAARAKDVGATVDLCTLRDEGHAAWSDMERYYAWIHAFIEKPLW